MRPGSPARRRLTPALLVMAMVAALLPLGQAATAATNTAIQLNGTTQYATLGTNTQLRSGQFTLELWFKRTGTGTVIGGTGTGSGGLPTTVIPLIAKGRAEAETAAADVNYFFGIDSATNKLVADFEEARNTAGGTQEGLNHPIFGNSVVTSNVWHHAAATYDGVAWNLYLDGVNDGTLTVNRVANSATQVITSIGTSLNTSTTLTPTGFFQGQIDEVRIWNSARSAGQIASGMNQEQGFSTGGLLGRWGLNEGTGTTYGDTSTSAIAGAGVATPSWVAGATALDPPAPGANGSLAFNGLSQYVDMGTAAGLNTASWTVETWFKQTNNGTKAGSGTGNGGIANVIPLVSKGRSEAESTAADINYFLGLDVTDPANPKVAADFEEGSTGAIPGQNHPLVGSTSVTQNVWHHAAATYDGTTLRIYLDGVSQGSLVVSQPANAANTAHAALGTSFGSGATFLANGFFGGQLDEARIWNVARTQGEIQASMNTPITSGDGGLLARYGLNEGTGTSVGDSIAPAENGTLQPAANAPSWAAGAPALDGDVTAPCRSNRTCCNVGERPTSP